MIIHILSFQHTFHSSAISYLRCDFSQKPSSMFFLMHTKKKILYRKEKEVKGKFKVKIYFFLNHYLNTNCVEFAFVVLSFGAFLKKKLSFFWGVFLKLVFLNSFLNNSVRGKCEVSYILLIHPIITLLFVCLLTSVILIIKKSVNW